MIKITEQDSGDLRKRFQWDGIKGSVYTSRIGVQYISVSGSELQSIATRVLGVKDKEPRNSLASYDTYTGVDANSFATLLFEICNTAV